VTNKSLDRAPVFFEELENKEIRTMSRPMSELAPDITVEVDGHAESKTVLVAKISVSPRAAASRRCSAASSSRRAAAAVPPPPLPPTGFTVDTAPPRGLGRRSWAGSCSTGGRTMAGSAAPSPVSARAARSRMWWRTRARRQRCAARWTCCSSPPPTVPCGCCSLLRPLPASWPGLGPADPDPNFQFGQWLVTVRARPVRPDG
jgi:hypothetical protein